MPEQEKPEQEQGRMSGGETLEGNEWFVPSRREEEDRIIRALEERLCALGWNEEEIGLFPLAVGEAVVNAVTHGNLGIERIEGESFDEYQERLAAAEAHQEHAAKRVRVTVDANSDRAVISVLDEGKWFSEAFIKDMTSKENLLKHGGRGIGLMQKICDGVAFIPSGIQLTKYRVKPKASS